MENMMASSVLSIRHARRLERPHLTIFVWVWQRWIAFQLLHALAQAHKRGVCHGDIKCENAFVTSWNWVYLADFASYKPTYLPVDNPVRSTSPPFILQPWHPTGQQQDRLWQLQAHRHGIGSRLEFELW